MGQNSRYAIRTLLKNPGFTLIAVFALALGIGANTAIFTVVDRVLLRPLPYRDPDRLVNIARKFHTGTGPVMSIPKFAAIRQAGLLDAVSVYDILGPGMNLSGAGHPEQVRGVHVSEAYFRLLGVTPILTGVLFGLAPALQLTRPDLNSSLREGGARTTAGSRRQRTRNTLVVAETALSLVLLVGAALMIRTFLALRNVQPGFQAASVLTMNTSLAGQKYETAAGVERLSTELTRRLESLAGAQAATYALALPLQLGPDMPFLIAGKAPRDGGPSNGDEQYRPVGPHYFQTLGIPLRRGRWYDERDSSTGPWTLIVNDALAKKYWPNEDPLGATVTIGKGIGPGLEDRPRQVVGVVGDVRESGLDRDPPPVLYIPIGQAPNGFVAIGNRILPSSWAVRAIGDPAALARAVQQEVLRVDPDLPTARVMTMDRIIAKSIARQNFNMILLGIFGGIALLLAAIGIYGVMSYTVQQRTSEMGIRIALGAGTGQLLRLVVGQGLRLAGIGVAIGLAASFGVTRVMSSLLYGVQATDAATFAAVAAILSAVAVLACYVPARRATRVDPIVALHCE